MSKLSQTLNAQRDTLGKRSDYETTLKQLTSLITSETNLIANLANTTSLLKHNHHFFWVGFYIVDPFTNELVLGPFQGTLACTRIPFGKGVCGTAWKENRPIFVPNVHEFPGHIACDSKSETEIVITIQNPKASALWGVLDIDSDQKNGLTEADFEALKNLGKVLEQHLF